MLKSRPQVEAPNFEELSKEEKDAMYEPFKTIHNEHAKKKRSERTNALNKAKRAAKKAAKATAPP